MNTIERMRSATYGPVVISLATHRAYETQLPGDNFGHAWRTARLFFPLEGALRFHGANTCAERSAALAVGWHPVQVACSGAQVLEVDLATERFFGADSLFNYNFASWAPETCLPSATAAALRELMDHPVSTPEILAETTIVVQALIESLLTVAPTASA